MTQNKNKPSIWHVFQGGSLTDTPSTDLCLSGHILTGHWASLHVSITPFPSPPLRTCRPSLHPSQWRDLSQRASVHQRLQSGRSWWVPADIFLSPCLAEWQGPGHQTPLPTLRQIQILKGSISVRNVAHSSRVFPPCMILSAESQQDKPWSVRLYLELENNALCPRLNAGLSSCTVSLSQDWHLELVVYFTKLVI